VRKLPKAQPWAKKRPPSSPWRPTPKDIFKHIDVIRRAVARAGIRPGDVDDTAADAIARAWEGLERFRGRPEDPERSFCSWLNAIAWRTAHDRRLREEQQSAVALRLRDLLDNVDVTAPGVHEQIAARLTLRKAIGKLTPTLRATAILLAVHEGLGDAAGASGIPVGTAATRARAIRKKLRRLR
jgi:DNA-directed RNA polymerase specialized sigma24 family protein